MQGEYAVYDEANNLLGYIDRTDTELGDNEDECIYCTLPCGFQLRFWNTRLTDMEYIRRTNLLKE